MIPTSDLNARETLVSRWPPLLRWIEDVTASANVLQAAVLDWLERHALRSYPLRRFLIAAHRRSFQSLLAHIPSGPVRIGVVGGGLFPRTVLVLRDLLPDARLAIVDSNAAHLDQACAQLGAAAAGVELVASLFQTESCRQRFDVVVIPLAYRGDREVLYQRPPAPVTLIHDWIWRRRGCDGRRISWLLLKRLNLVLT